ncbi:CAAX prenyl protease 2 isoform X1 [Phoenix dactylifera]|uniref:intramembrane prenyl-peptidase Rce1 n=1 Tax=Phoenix dactylifera TaxID=42345 RepID=A0A8B7BYR5_PHODC|nr:CAAX prenyl protease 2 isoform X1 [Phoenix dactylifera]
MVVAPENPLSGESAAAGSVPGSAALAACAAMAIFYVAILYSPTLILRLPPPSSIDSFMIRRFACAIVSSAVSVLASAILLGLGRFRDLSSVLGVFGIRKDHLCQAVVFPLFLTSLLYAGSLVKKSWSLMITCGGVRPNSCCEVRPYGCDRSYAQRCLNWTSSCARNVMVWRNYVVAPFTEEMVFRACMIPLLLCGGFKTYTIIFLSPVFFSLAHLNHFLELYFQQKYSFLKAFLIVGLQLGYTVIFGWYASFLFIRTGNLISPIVAHIFCNMMGLPVLSSSRTKGVATMAFAAGLAGFCWLLFPATSPDLYNDQRDGCSCWQGYCSWN